jgi:hypothetical protein
MRLVDLDVHGKNALVMREVEVRAQRVLGRGAVLARDTALSLTDRGRRMVDAMPDDARQELRTSIRRLAAVRSPKEALQALETEAGRLSRAVVPVLAEHPLPVRDRVSARMVVGTTAGLAAAFAELDQLAIVLTDGVAAPTAVSAGAALLAAFVTEIWVAVSVRAHQITSAGREVDSAVLADEVVAALLGTDLVFVRQLAGRAATTLGKRMTKRWAAGLIPFAGVVVDAWAASRTVRAISRLPLDAHPASFAAPLNTF